MQKRKLGNTVTFFDTAQIYGEENIGAANVDLTASDLREIEDAASKITVHGERYPVYLQERVGR